MYALSKYLATAFAAALIIAVMGGSAAALRSLEVSATEIRSTARALTFRGGGAEVVCELTLNTTLKRAIRKVRGIDAGRAEVRFQTERCRGGRMRHLEVQVWRVNLDTFTGTLPNIRSVRLVLKDTEFLIAALGGLGECLFRGDAQGTTGPNDRAAEFRMAEEVAIRLLTMLNGVFCPEEGVFIGTFLTERTVTLRLV